MLGRGAKDKAGIGERFELDRLMTFVEYRGFARRYLFWRPYSPPVGCDPGDVMSLGRLNLQRSPAFRRTSRYVRPVGDFEQAFHAVIFASDDAGGPGKIEV